MRLLFMGTPEFARIILEQVSQIEGIEVVGVYSQPDRPVGRKQLMTPPPVAEFAAAQGWSLFQPERLDELEEQRVRALAPDLILVAAFGQLVPPVILQMAPCINLHTSLLPKYRGASPLQESFLRGDCYAGVTAMHMDAGLDTGAILGSLYVVPPKEATYGCYLNTMAYMAAGLFRDILRLWPALRPLAQHHCDASVVRKRRKEEGIVKLNNAAELYRKYQGLTPWPGIALADGLKLLELYLEEETHAHTPGTILAVSGGRLLVGCRQGSFWIAKLKPPGKAAMEATAYANGRRLKVGDTLV